MSLPFERRHFLQGSAALGGTLLASGVPLHRSANAAPPRIDAPVVDRVVVQEITDGELEFQDSFLTPIGKRQILTRMLRNLKAIYVEQQDYSKTIAVINKLIILNPDIPEEIRDRGIIYYQMQAFKSAKQDLEDFLSVVPDSQDSEMIHQYLQILREYCSHLN